MGGERVNQLTQLETMILCTQRMSSPYFGHHTPTADTPVKTQWTIFIVQCSRRLCKYLTCVRESDW